MIAATFASLALAATPPVAAPPVAANPEAVVRAMFAAFNRHDAAAMARLYAADARLTSSDFCNPRGRADVPRTYTALFSVFPDIHDDLQTVVVRGGMVAVRFTAKSRKGAQPMDLPIATFLTVRDGLIETDDSLFDAGGRPCTR